MAMSGKTVGLTGVLAAILIAGCCDSGGGSSGSSDLPGLNVPQGEATVASGTEAAVMVIGKDYTGGIVLPTVSSTSDAAFDPLSHVKRMVAENDVMASFTAEIRPAASESYTHNCESGTILISLTTNDSGTSESATMVYDQCLESGIVSDGTIKTAITAAAQNDYHFVLLTLDVSFPTDFTVTENGSVYTVHQGTYVNDTFTTYDYVNEHIAGTEKSSLWIDFNGSINYRFDDLTVQFDNNFSNYTSMQCFQSGRIYVGNLAAYLDINEAYDPNCEHKFMWNFTYTYPLYSGSMELLGSNGSRVLVTADPDSEDFNVTVR